MFNSFLGNKSTPQQLRRSLYQELGEIDTAFVEYDFAQPETEQFIVYKDEPRTEIKFCTIEKLIEKLTQSQRYYLTIGM